MKTSYFSVSTDNPNAVSISISHPDHYRGRQYRDLAPPAWLLDSYRIDHNEETYIKKYTEFVLDKLDPQGVYNELGEDAVLLCWEKPGSFCHRQIVARWFEKNLGVKVEELSITASTRLAACPSKFRPENDDS